MAISSALKMFCRSGSLIANSIFLDWLYIPYLAFSCVQVSLICCGGRKEPFV